MIFDNLIKNNELVIFFVVFGKMLKITFNDRKLTFIFIFLCLLNLNLNKELAMTIETYFYGKKHNWGHSKKKEKLSTSRIYSADNKWNESKRIHFIGKLPYLYFSTLLT